MTIGIGITLDDGVLLVADGRYTYPDGRPTVDNFDKFEPVTTSIRAIAFGERAATSIALQRLRQDLLNQHDEVSPEEVRRRVTDYLETSWNNLVDKLGEEEVLQREDMQAALLVGGLSANIPFITVARFTVDRKRGLTSKPEDLLVTTSSDSIVLGGEKQEADVHFGIEAQRAFEQHSASPGEGLENDLVSALLNLAATTIRMVETSDETVGGTIRYMCIRRGYQYPRSSSIYVEKH